jgi:type IV secretory pathway TraG/TraD family ATPase VirD4
MSEKANKGQTCCTWVAAAHLGAAAVVVYLGWALDGRRQGDLPSQLVAALCAAAVVGAALSAIAARAKLNRPSPRGQFFNGAKRVAGSVALMAVLVWAGAGLAVEGVAELVARLAGPEAPVTMPRAAITEGPFAALSAANGALGRHGLALVLWLALAAWAAVWASVGRAFLARDRARMKTLQTLVEQAKEVLGAGKRAANKAPHGAHWAETVSELEGRTTARPEGEVLLGRAKLAEDWGRPLKGRWVKLGPDDSAFVIGGPGSNKTGLFIRTLLNLQAGPGSKTIVTSTKPRDIAAVVTRWLRSQGFTVHIWDLTRSIPEDDRSCGDAVRWSPLSSLLGFDDAKRIAGQLVQAAKDEETRIRDDFWVTQAVAILAPAMLAAKLEGRDYEVALDWATRWADADFVQVQRTLAAYGEDRALRSWVEVRKMLLSQDRNDPLTWAEHTSAGGAAATGLSISATLSGLMLSLATDAAHACTRDPNFDPHSWLSTPGPAVLFLIGDQLAPEMTRALLVPLVQELVDRAMRTGNRVGGRLSEPLLILLDEIAQNPIPHLARLLSTGRSFGIRTLAAAQSLGQLRTTYGRDTSSTLLDAATATLVLSGLVDSDLIGILDRAGGHREEEVTSTTKVGETKSTTTTTQLRPLIDGHVVTSLRPPRGRAPGEGILVVGGAKVRLELPVWSFDPQLNGRGDPLAEHRESHVAYTAALSRRPRAFAQKAWRRLAAKRQPVGDVAGASLSRTAAATASGTQPAPVPSAPTPPSATTGPVGFVPGPGPIDPSTSTDGQQVATRGQAHPGRAPAPPLAAETDLARLESHSRRAAHPARGPGAAVPAPRRAPPPGPVQQRYLAPTTWLDLQQEKWRDLLQSHRPT